MSLARSSGLFAAGTLLSRVSGLIRDQVILAIFGASALQDAFTVAFRIPNLLRDMLAEGALGNAFTKVYTSIRQDDPARGIRLLHDFLQLTFLASVVICSAGIVFAPQLVALMTTFGSSKDAALAADPQFIHNTTGLTRILFPYLGLAILGAVVMGALHQGGRFFLSAISPLGFNLGNIVGALLFAKVLTSVCGDWIQLHIADPSITGLAVGVLIGGVAQLTMQASGIYRSSIKGQMRWRGLPWSEDTKKVLMLMAPAAIAASSGPVNVMINTNFATSLQAGSVSWLNFAFRLLQLPVGIFGVAVGSAVLPALARSIRAQGSRTKAGVEASGHLQNATELVLWALVPCMIFLAVNSVPLMDALFRHGHFSRSDAVHTANALFAYSFGLIGYGLIKVFTSFYFAVERTSYAMVVSLLSIAVNYIGNSILVERYAYQGLAWTASLSLTVNATILFLGLRRHKIDWNVARLGRSLGILALATAATLGANLGAWQVVERASGAAGVVEWYENAGKIEVYGMLSLNIVLTILIFGLAAAVLLKQSPQKLLQTATKRLRR